MFSIKTMRKKLASSSGFSIIELLIAAVVTSIVAGAALQFYGSLHGQSETQVEISDVQNICRITLQEIKKTLRMAGYKTGTHAPFEINGDTLAIYMKPDSTVDTTLYFLQEYADYEYSQMKGFPTGKKLYRLMKQEGSNAPAAYSDYLGGVTVVQIDSANVAITVTAFVTKADEKYPLDNGYRSFSSAERVKLRNVG